MHFIVFFLCATIIAAPLSYRFLVWSYIKTSINEGLLAYAWMYSATLALFAGLILRHINYL